MYKLQTLFGFGLFVSGVIAQSATGDAIPPWQTGIITEDGTCGSATPGWVCSPSWGACCSKDGQCGRSTAFCGAGCQVGYGNCNAPAPPAPGPGSPSPDGSCGGTKQYKCTGATYGDCCSSSGFCGDTAGHCGSGCQTLFGTCKDTGNVTTDGHCGPTGADKTCLGSTYGNCCSSGGFCGDSADHCGPGCLVAFGNCTIAANVTTDGTCGSKNGKICKGSGYGDCCSSSGFCGSATDHCGAGCQLTFGNCTGGASDISTDGDCGTKNGKTCKGSTFGDCCSSSGFCGATSGHCSAGCQSGFGTCSTGAGDISTDGSCGKNGKTCTGSTFGDCCSSSGFCGGATDHCGAGCQASFGTCGSGSGTISTDGSCGTKNGKTCKGSNFGDCCSSSGFCGGTSDHCSAGCQSSYGTCSSGSGDISTDGSCGKNGKICKGSTFGDCCSSSGFCGSKTDHCGAGCQTGFGTCTGGSSGISTDGACGKNGKTCSGSTFGKCCSGGGFCGNTANHCGQGCQSSFSNTCITTNIPSVDGSCGSSKGGLTCNGGDFNNQCCSSGGFCGTTTGHCGTGCQKGFGRCT
ncbi:hypothetical protein EDB81DRAFT_952826 [Dactylonectria macrodidyma]|uniref:Chitin-binding type-1 domain-containing protein n=1 Tax=Dactylonectria macrodidyma TaxID=307937 RepID=A0A9P9DBD9_9HYPO|nr:hypothetical protein EDB81DRAFT_952826 [Dactylonectria macrodidyma]